MKNIPESILKYLYFLVFMYFEEGSATSNILTSGIVDLSHWNKNVNFLVAKRNGVTAVIHKATEGLNFVDSMYKKRMTVAESLNILWGAYHFATSSNGTQQADHFLNKVGNIKGILLALDLETNPNSSTVTLKVAIDFINRIKQKTGHYPHVYGSPNFLNDFSVPPITECPLWIASWRQTPTLPKGWSDFVIWQHTNGEKGFEPDPVPGIGRCDKDKFNGSDEDLKAYWSAQNKS